MKAFQLLARRWPESPVDTQFGTSKTYFKPSNASTAIVRLFASVLNLMTVRKTKIRADRRRINISIGYDLGGERDIRRFAKSKPTYSRIFDNLKMVLTTSGKPSDVLVL